MYWRLFQSFYNLFPFWHLTIAISVILDDLGYQRSDFFFNLIENSCYYLTQSKSDTHLSLAYYVELKFIGNDYEDHLTTQEIDFPKDKKSLMEKNRWSLV